MAVDCIPHAWGKPVTAHARHHRHQTPITRIVVKAVAKPHTRRHHVRLRECAPGAVVAPLADMDDENVAAIYMLPNAGPARPVSNEAAATPAQASGLDLRFGGPTDIDAFGGGSSGSVGVPPSFGGGSSGGGSPPATGGGGGSGSGGGGGGGGGGGTGPIVGGGDGTGPGPVISGVPATTGGGGGSTTGPGQGGSPTGGGGVTGVPEPATWALMLIGVGAIGGLRRRQRRPTVSA